MLGREQVRIDGRQVSEGQRYRLSSVNDSKKNHNESCLSAGARRQFDDW